MPPQILKIITTETIQIALGKSVPGNWLKIKDEQSLAFWVNIRKFSVTLLLFDNDLFPILSDTLTISYEIAFLDLEPGPPFCPFDYLEIEKEVDGEFVRKGSK